MRLPVGIVVVALGVGLGASSGQAHHSDWGLPLVGGLVGGAGLTALYYNHERSQEREQAARPPAPAAPAAAPAAPAVPSATTIEDKLNVLDQLAAKGYITPEQYKERRQALLDQL